MSNCQKIEQATRNISEKPSAEELEALTRVFQDAYPSKLMTSDLLKQSMSAAKDMERKGAYTEHLPTGIPGAKALLQQNNGKPQFLELTEGNRQETLRLDPRTSEPVINSVTENCNGKYNGMSTTIFEGKVQTHTLHLPSGKEITVWPDGKRF